MTDDSTRVPNGLTTEGVLPRRYLARFIDGLAVGLILSGFEPVLLSVLRCLSPIDYYTGNTFAIGVVSYASIFVVYGTVFEWSPLQATLGKRLMGLRVHSALGGRLRFARAAERNLLKDGPMALIPLMPGVVVWALLVWWFAQIVAGFRSSAQRTIYDRIAHSLVAMDAVTELRLT